MRAARLRPLLVVALAFATAGPGAPAARAGYPDVCFAAVEGVDQRLLVGAAAPRDGDLVALVRGLGGEPAARMDALGFREVRFATPAARDAALAALRRVPWVDWAEPTRALAAHRTANDPQYRRQWGLAKIQAPRAWDVEVGTRNPVTVAVLDTGVDYGHPDLRGKLLPGIDVVNDDTDAQDDHSHGTHVAGVIAAATNNRVGIAGISWGAKVLPVKVLAADGGGTSCDIVVGMVQAADEGAQIQNMSLGGPFPCPVAFRLAVEYANHEGSLIVASSGNDALVGAPESAPANCPGVLGVAATDDKDEPGIFSSFGPTVDVAAPGVSVYSTYFDPKSGQHTYASLSGTSMAAPHVAGLAALLKSRNPAWTPAEISARIVATADDRGPRGRDDYYGAGRINAARALGAR